jgi:NADH:ubiquinone oxidoreductase subunit 6 (subunit J)
MSTMNAAAFFILGALILAAAVATVGLPRVREAAAGLLVLTTGAGVMALASGAYLTGVIEIVVSAAAIVGFAYALSRSGHADLARFPMEWSLRSTAMAATGALVFAVLLLIAFSGNASDWHHGSGSAALVTLLHYRAPFALVVALLALVVGVAGAVLIGRRSRDEVEFDRTVQARMQREERTRKRREDREAARRRRRSRRSEGAA